MDRFDVYTMILAMIRLQATVTNEGTQNHNKMAHIAKQQSTK